MEWPLLLRKGAWTHEEDNLLRKCIQQHGEGRWHLVPLKAGLNRCRKSCRLRWLNYLKPDIKRGELTFDEVDLIIRLHRLLGNRWALIAGRLPGRTANGVKNYENTHLRKSVNSSKEQHYHVKSKFENMTKKINAIKPQPYKLSPSWVLKRKTQTTNNDTDSMAPPCFGKGQGSSSADHEDLQKERNPIETCETNYLCKSSPSDNENLWPESLLDGREMNRRNTSPTSNFVLEKGNSEEGPIEGETSCWADLGFEADFWDFLQ